ncbi:MAG: hypothetical protein CMF50_00055 [Legionellales bacterium]|nr:hypothetical protein [Legionellales bacterium]|tara:strand:+ start:10148 stop:10564 length:417 start_codon:yes stop_codon:yes gene_type:complete
MKILVAIFASCCLAVGSAVAAGFHDLGGQDIGPNDHRCWGYLPSDHGPADKHVSYDGRCIIQSKMNGNGLGVEITGETDVDGSITLNGGPVRALKNSDRNVLLIRDMTFRNNADHFCLYNRSDKTTIRANCSLHENGK